VEALPTAILLLLIGCHARGRGGWVVLHLLPMPLKLGLCCGSGAGSALPAARSLFCSATPLFL